MQNVDPAVESLIRARFLFINCPAFHPLHATLFRCVWVGPGKAPGTRAGVPRVPEFRYDASVAPKNSESIPGYQGRRPRLLWVVEKRIAFNSFMEKEFLFFSNIIVTYRYELPVCIRIFRFQ